MVGHGSWQPAVVWRFRLAVALRGEAGDGMGSTMPERLADPS